MAIHLSSGEVFTAGKISHDFRGGEKMAQNMKEKSEVHLARKLFSNIDEYRIATHKRLDADAAFSTALILSLQKNPQPVIFVDSTDVITDDNVMLLDFDLEENSIKGDGVGSCFGLLVKVMNRSDPVFYNYLITIAKHLNRTDSGKNDFHSYLDPHYLIRWWRLAKLDDSQIIHTIYLLFKGMQKSVEKEEEAQAYLKTYGRKEKFCMIVENPPKDAKIQKFVFRNGAGIWALSASVISAYLCPLLNGFPHATQNSPEPE